MPLPDTQDPVMILGAGIVGICTALSLLERGVPVTLIDKGAPGQETSMGNAGVVSPWSFIPQAMPGIWKNIPKLMLGYGRPLSIHPRSAIRMLPWGLRFLGQGNEAQVRASAKAMSHLCDPSIELYQKHLSGTGHEDLITDSFYVHAFRNGSKARLDALEYRLRSEMGAPLDLVGKDELARLEPALSSAFNGAVVIKDQARVRSPGRLGQVLAQKASAMGAQIKQTAIHSLKKDTNTWRIECQDETFIASRVVVCLGAWSRGLLTGLPFKIPLMAERGYHAEFANAGITLNNSVMDTDAKVVASSMEGGLRIAGQAEFAPVDAPPSMRKQQHLVSIAKTAFPDLNTTEPSFWMGRRPSFPDSLPMLGALPDQPGLFLNFGHSHYGLMMAPKSGEVMAQVICEERANSNLEAYRPDRF